jgi:hypothetical protein
VKTFSCNPSTREAEGRWSRPAWATQWNTQKTNKQTNKKLKFFFSFLIRLNLHCGVCFQKSARIMSSSTVVGGGHKSNWAKLRGLYIDCEWPCACAHATVTQYCWESLLMVEVFTGASVWGSEWCMAKHLISSSSRRECPLITPHMHNHMPSACVLLVTFGFIELVF